MFGNILMYALEAKTASSYNKTELPNEESYQLSLHKFN